MISEWFQRVGKFSTKRIFKVFYFRIIEKEITYWKRDYRLCSIEQSNGIWKPSPGLIYPLLGRLLDEGLIEETKDGRYQITKKGKRYS